LLKTRVISAVIGLSLLTAAVVISDETLAVAVFVLSIAAIHEFYSSMSNAGYKPVKIAGYLMCLIILLIGFANLITTNFHVIGLTGKSAIMTKYLEYILFGIFAFILILYSLPVFIHSKYNMADISVTLYGIFYVVFLFAFIVLTRNLEHGAYLIWLIFIGAWSTDTFAYFGGKTLGNKKLAPVISPKKTIAGSISGIIGCILTIAVYGLLLQKYLSYIPFYHYIIIGTLCGIISQIGDLVASSIKRYTKIKDYGYIIPGHGGVLDRFDSVLFTAPVVYFYIIFFITSH